MPWNNQNSGGGGGGWKSGGGGGPWGQGPSGGGGGGGNQPPDLEEFLKRGQDRLKQVMPGSGLPGPLFLLLAAIATAVLGFYALTFQVKPDEQGVVLRFGQYVRWEPAGLHFRWPYPVEEVYLPKVLQQRISEIGMRTVGRPGAGSQREHPEESLMLTGDENIVDVNFTVYWRIRTDRDPKTNRWGVEQYLFNIEDPQNTVKEVSESVMREFVGESDLQPILTEARQKIEQKVQKLIQDVLDSYGSGIRVDQVQLQKVDPPREVIDSFVNVQTARQDRERLQSEAQAYANKKVPEARGAAERILLEAEGYKLQTVAEAVGQSARFLNVYEEYKKAPDVTRKRIFLETMERVLGGADKVIIDNKGGQGVVPFLPLDQLQSKK